MISRYIVEGSKETLKKLDAVYSVKGSHIPYNIEALKEYRELGGKCIELDNHIEYLQALRSVEQKARNNYDNNDIDPRLRHYQVADVRFLKLMPNPALFNAPRTGKTLTTLMYIKEKGYKKVIVAVPSSTVIPWCNECEKWLGIKAMRIKGSLKERKELYSSLAKMEDFIAVVSYDTLKLDTSYLIYPIDLLVVDEAHFLRNDSKRTAGINKVAFVAKNKMVLTGTPAIKHASDVFYILKFLYPNVFRGYWQFAERYFNIGIDWFSKARVVGTLKAHRAEEFHNLVAHYCVQRKLEDVISWLPEVVRYPEIVLDFDKTQAKHYKNMLDDFYSMNIEEGTELDAPNTLSQLMRLRQLALDPQIVGLDGKSPKTEWLLQYIKDNPDEPIIVFSQFTSYLNRLSEVIGAEKCVLYTGRLTKEKKQKSIDKFQKGDVNIILVNIQAGGVGITLDRAVTEIFTDHVWSPHELEQAEARFLPTTEDKAKEVRGIYYLMMKDSVDYRLRSVMEHKSSSTINVNDVISILREGGRINE